MRASRGIVVVWGRVVHVTGPVLGVVFRPQSPPELLREVAVAADRAGVAELWLWEDCFAEGGLTTAALALAWTERLHVGIGLLPVPLRNPALAAMEIATLARTFPGRLLPGLGHGILDWMEQVGARETSPMTLLREHTSAIRALLHGETLDVEGRYVTIRDVTLDWPPPQVPPLLVGARGPRTVALANELADGVILDSSATADTVREVRAVSRGRLVVFTDVDDPAQIPERAAELGEAGADAIAFTAPEHAPDPLPLIAAIART
jgi:alkanesulfonate monooxygenase SsuD/methylene tetrahydromethanopterin reductase-like flavin-dependent oxidoreductase (luciferase family)